MNSKSIFLFLIFSALTLRAVPQSEPSVLITAKKAEQMAVDRQGNVYVVQGAILYKYDERGTLLHSYSNLMAGHITAVDVSNPLKLMLFYQEVAEIYFLDDKLAPISKLNLADMGYYTISLAAYSPHNYLWLYDYANRDLLCLDFLGNEKSRSHLGLPDFAPTQLTCLKEQGAIFHNPSTGVCFLDAFATLVKTIPVETPCPVQVEEGILYYVKEDTLHAYDLNKLELHSRALPLKLIKQFYVNRGAVYLLDERGRIWTFSWS